MTGTCSFSRSAGDLVAVVVLLTQEVAEVAAGRSLTLVVVAAAVVDHHLDWTAEQQHSVLVWEKPSETEMPSEIWH